MDRERVTALLRAHAAGDGDAMAELLPLVYAELRGLARKRLQAEYGTPILDDTDLVHEAYLRLAGLNRIDWKNHRHFLAVASRMMRYALVDDARSRMAAKRGGRRQRVPLSNQLLADEPDLERCLAVHEALSHLAARDERKVRVVECRFFAGLTIDETADALGISPATVGRDWHHAREWLNRALTADT